MRRSSGNAYQHVSMSPSSSRSTGQEVEETTNPQITSDSVVSKSAKRAVLLALILLLFTDFALLTAVVPTVPETLDKAGIPNFAIIALFASKAFVQICANPFIGKTVDKIGPLLPLMLGMTVLTASAAAFGFVLLQDVVHGWGLYGLLMGCRAIQGVASSAAMAGGMTLLAAMHSADERGGPMSTAMLGVALGAMSGAPLGGIIADHLGNYTPFFVLTGVSLCSNGLFLAVWAGTFSAPGDTALAELRPAADDDEGDEWAVYRNPFILLPAGALVLANAGVAAIEPMVPLYLANDPFNESTMMQVCPEHASGRGFE